MSLGGIFGAIGGGIVGFFIPGIGPFLGAAIGFSLGTLIDPTTPDIKTPYRPSDQLQLPSNTIGAVVSDGLGTVKVVGGQLLFYGRSRAVPQYEKVSGGKGGGSKKQKVLTGYKYYCSWGIGILAGPICTLYTILKDNKEVVWEGELQRPGSGESETLVIGGMGSAQFFFGTGEQEAWPDVAKVITDPALNIPYRGLCWIYFQNCYIGTYNRIPTLSFVLRKSPVFAFSNKEVIQTFDYNPMHGAWYVLSHLSKLPEDWLHSENFAAVASTLRSESRGISVLFSSQQSALNWLESINEHIGNIFRYGSDGKFHPKLIRDDYDPDDPLFPVVDESIVLDKPEFSRKSWIDTINEVKVQYSQIINCPFDFTFECSLDTRLYSIFPDNPYEGLSLGIRVVDTHQPVWEILRTILRFNFASIPVGATITSATLSLWWYGISGLSPQGRTYWAYELTQLAWTGDATWNKYDGVNAWDQAGGDYTTSKGTSIIMPTWQAPYGFWIDWDVTALVKHFFSSHGKVANFLLKDSNEDWPLNANFGSLFRQSEYEVPEERPKLHIYWSI